MFRAVRLQLPVREFNCSCQRVWLVKGYDSKRLFPGKNPWYGRLLPRPLKHQSVDVKLGTASPSPRCVRQFVVACQFSKDSAQRASPRASDSVHEHSSSSSLRKNNKPTALLLVRNTILTRRLTYGHGGNPHSPTKLLNHFKKPLQGFKKTNWCAQGAR